MKSLLFKLVVKMLFTILTPNLAQALYDKLIDAINKHVASTSYTIDDIIWNAIKHSGDTINDLCDTMLDFVEDYVLGTESKIDDLLVLPIIEMIKNIKSLSDEE